MNCWKMREDDMVSLSQIGSCSAISTICIVLLTAILDPINFSLLKKIIIQDTLFF